MKYFYWFVPYGADCTETGCTMNRAYIRTVWNGYESQYDKEIAAAHMRDFCRLKFGAEVAYVQGVAPCFNWSIHDSNAQAWERAERQRWGGYPTTALRITLEIERDGRFVETLSETNPIMPPQPAYEDLLRENRELRQQLAARDGDPLGELEEPEQPVVIETPLSGLCAKTAECGLPTGHEGSCDRSYDVPF